ncbi:substrate-binding domain-containing protein [Thiohalomonas denitrificans]|uniref:Phosphate ABC transporter substrate-binding protein, PhoT family n=1 Tax=Thiohalomonas denitrificans TaxID=415747 RepID=A0A1G5PS52_9GAMM|nr:substrate-binding domain-containing protein [Thiohalomonas denitrificans]SCZ52156.1 phosphate ABC transporter substrate-binding protein, PhoT family [Thiohalomonas denitrificans]
MDRGIFWGVIISLTVTVNMARADDTVNWVGCGISKLGYMQALADAFENETGAQFDLAGGGATLGLRSISSGKAQLGGSCRLPLLNASGDGAISSEEKLKLIPIGWDALVVTVHPENQSVSDITREQLKDVLTGKITTWGELGGSPDRPINLYVRKGKISGVGLTLRQQLFDNPDQPFAQRATVLQSSGKIEKAVEGDPDGFAVSGISSSRQRALKMLDLEGVDPSLITFKRGKYPLYRILFLVAPQDYESDPLLSRFVDFTFSVEGQRTIQNAGTLPFHRGALLLMKASRNYVSSLEVMSNSGIYTIGGH